MRSNKQSITLKVIVGYLLIAALAVVAVWFVYSQVISYTSMAESNASGNAKLYLVGEAAANLYEAESLSRQVIQTGEPETLDLYLTEIDSVRLILDSLQTYTGNVLEEEIHSINFLLAQKTDNLEELLLLRAQEENQSYYSKVIAELQKVDETFEDPNYEERFQDLEPHQRRILVKLLEYSENDNAEEVTSQTVDSLVNSVKSVLTELELADINYRQTVRNKENELLANEISLNFQLRNLLSTIEEEERQTSLAQVEASQKMVKSTSQTIGILGAISFLVILVFLLLIVRDVSRSRQYRNQLENAKQYAETLLKRREQFMAMVTHDLRSPLTTVIGYTNLLEKSQLDKSQTNYLNHLKNSSDFTLRLVNDLLDLSKLEAGKMSIEKLNFNPKNLIENTVENTVSVEKKKAVLVKVEISEEVDQNVHSDPFRIKQILTNLLANACKFTQKGSITVTANLERKKNQHILNIVVKDTGIGISKNKKEAVFEEFSQENNSIEKRFGGSGLGLTISKKITDLLKGSIKLESESGKGSEFTLRIPVSLAQKNQIPISEKKPLPNKDISNYKVLIVDDEPAQLSLLSEFIKAAGMIFTTSGNGKEATEKLKSEKFDLVLTDIQMPKMDGFELLSFIRNTPRTKKLPVIALSGKTDTTAPEYLKKGFNGSLLKPYSPEKLLEIIEQVLQVAIQRKTNAANKQTSKSNQNYSLEEVKLFAGGDEAALNIILSAFIESTKSNLEVLKKGILEGDKEKIAAVAHKMLPMFRQIKTTAIVKQLELLETGEALEIKKVETTNLTSEINQLMKSLEPKITV